MSPAMISRSKSSEDGPKKSRALLNVGRLAVLTCLVVLPALMPSNVRADEKAVVKTEDRETNPLVLANIEKFRDLKFGLFIHWGPCTQWGARIAWPLSPSQTWARPDDLPAWVERGKNFDVFSRDFFDLNKTFNPSQFDPDAWAKAAKRGGMKYIVFVTKCHDGFALFDTKQSNYCSTDPSCAFHTNPRANIAKAVLEAFRRQGLRTALYFSMPDWRHPDYEDPTRPAARLFRPNYDVTKHPEKWGRYLKFMHAQVEELMTGYGPIDVLWLDGGAGDDWKTDELAAMARHHQPGILIVHRGAGGRYENYRTPEQQIPAKALPYAWETCLTMGDYWAYNPKDYYKPARELIHLIAEIACKGGNLLLDIGPDAEGRFPPESVKRLEELGDWLKINGEAIYGTRPVAPYGEGRVRLTRKGDAVYLIHLAELAQTKPPRAIAVSTIQPAEGAEVTLLGKGLPLKWEKRGHGMVAFIPDHISNPLRGEYPYCRHAWTVKISKAIVQPEEKK
ncbi:MAG: alpha-L-fucosidase [Pirellulales bacterium]|nr:alpha-L-fucosidase [Pirellulales bacterium]